MVSLMLKALILVGAATPVQPVGVRIHGRSLRGSVHAQPGGQVRPLSVPGRQTPIHMLISSFEDGPRCAATIFRALHHAENPQRLSFNVLQAAGPEDVDCLQEFSSRKLPKLCDDELCKNNVLSQVHFWKIPPAEGEGPVHQRGILSDLANVSGKDSMCLSTDSHMDFTQGWDRDLLEDWMKADNEFAVLTAYPLAIADRKIAGKQSWISLCGYYLSQGVPRGSTAGTMFSQGADSGKPVLTMNWAAGQSFSRCHAERNVPVDKHLHWIFDGEEVDRAVRLWTHGYDLYNPKVDVVLHNYSHVPAQFWDYTSPTKDADLKASEERLARLLQGRANSSEFGRFGLGSQRSLEDYVTWSHTDLGGRWRAVLAGKGIRPLLEGRGEQPGSIPEFCQRLHRRPVRNTEELVASIGA